MRLCDTVQIPRALESTLERLSAEDLQRSIRERTIVRQTAAPAESSSGSLVARGAKPLIPTSGTCNAAAARTLV